MNVNREISLEQLKLLKKFHITVESHALIVTRQNFIRV